MKKDKSRLLLKNYLKPLKKKKLVLDWTKRTRADVQLTIEDMLWDKLPDTKYTPELMQEKCELVYQHVYDSYYGAGLSIIVD